MKTFVDDGMFTLHGHPVQVIQVYFSFHNFCCAEILQWAFYQDTLKTFPHYALTLAV